MHGERDMSLHRRKIVNLEIREATSNDINKIGCLAIFYNIVVLMNNVAAVGSAMLLLQLMWITIKLFV